MATVTVRPNADNTTTNIALTGGATAAAVTSDDSDASYFTTNGAFGGTGIVELGTFALPALAQVRSVTPRIRASGGGPGHNFAFGVDTDLTDPLNAAVQTAAAATFTGAALTTRPDGVAWSQADIDALRLRMTASADNGTRFYEGYVDVVYNEAPVATPTGPATPVQDASQPTVTFTYADPEGDVQERRQIRVFPAAVYGAGGFDPATSPSVAQTGTPTDPTEFSSSTSWAVTAPLTNGVTYRAYVRVADAGSGGRYGPWAFVQFLMLVDPPAIPTVLPTPNGPGASMSVLISGRDNYLSTNEADMEVDASGWTAGAFNTVTRSVAAGSFSHGAASLALTATSANVIAAVLNRTTATRAPAAPGQTWTSQAKFKANTTGRSMAVTVDFYNAAGALLSSFTGANVNDTNAGFTLATATAVAPAGTASVSMGMGSLGAVANGEVHFVDEIGLAPGAATAWTRGGLINPAVSPMGVTFQLQRSNDGGATWHNVSGATPTSLLGAQAPLETVTVVDFEAARDTAVQYRAKAATVVAGKTLTSDWSAVASATVPIQGTWLKSRTDPTKNAQIDIGQWQLNSTSTERQGVHDGILGRADPVINSDVVATEVFDDFDVHFKTDAAYQAFETLRRRKEPLLLQLCYGDAMGEQYWVRLTEARKTLRLTVDSMATAQPRTVTIGAREVVVADPT